MDILTVKGKIKLINNKWVFVSNSHIYSDNVFEAIEELTGYNSMNNDTYEITIKKLEDDNNE